VQLPIEGKSSLGARGEDEAARAYARRGARVLARNERNACGEIDLVVEEGEVLVAVEVKTRTLAPDGAPPMGRPAEAVSRARLDRLARAFDLYAQARGLLGARRRLDVAEVLVDRGGAIREVRILDDVSA